MGLNPEAIYEEAKNHFAVLQGDSLCIPEELHGGFQHHVVRLGEVAVKVLAGHKLVNPLAITTEMAAMQAGLAIAEPIADSKNSFATETRLGWMRAFKYVEGESVGRSPVCEESGFKVGVLMAKLHRQTKLDIPQTFANTKLAQVLDIAGTEDDVIPPTYIEELGELALMAELDCIIHGDVSGRNIIITPVELEPVFFDFDTAMPMRGDMELIDGAMALAGSHNDFDPLPNVMEAVVRGYASEDPTLNITRDSFAYYGGFSLIRWYEKCQQYLADDSIPALQRQRYYKEIVRLEKQIPVQLAEIDAYVAHCQSAIKRQLT